jgi:hypothetical protein
MIDHFQWTVYRRLLVMLRHSGRRNRDRKFQESFCGVYASENITREKIFFDALKCNHDMIAIKQELASSL